MSLAEIEKEATAEKATKASLATAELVDKAPAAIEKLQARGDAAKLTMAELSAIAFAKLFNGTVLKGKKEDHVRSLNALIAAQPTMLNLEARVATPAPGTLVTCHSPCSHCLSGCTLRNVSACL